MLAPMGEAIQDRGPKAPAGRRFGGAFLIGLAVLLALAAGNGRVEAATCKNSTYKVKSSFKVEKGKLTYSSKLSKAELSKLHRRVGQDLEIRGLTVTKPVLSYSIAHRSISSGGGACVYPTHVDATIGYETIKVFVASEFRKRSCQYKAVLAHEKEHVAAHRKALKKRTPRIKARLNGILKKFKPIRLSKGENPTEAIARKIDAGLKRYLTNLSNEAEDLNAEIDLPKNYRKTKKMCKKWP